MGLCLFTVPIFLTEERRIWIRADPKISLPNFISKRAPWKKPYVNIQPRLDHTVCVDKDVRFELNLRIHVFIFVYVSGICPNCLHVAALEGLACVLTESKGVWIKSALIGFYLNIQHLSSVQSKKTSQTIIHTDTTGTSCRYNLVRFWFQRVRLQTWHGVILK